MSSRTPSMLAKRFGRAEALRFVAWGLAALAWCGAVWWGPDAAADEAGRAPHTSDRCTSYEDPMRLGRVEGDAIQEASGLAASRRFPGVFWTHNDSGDTHRLFALTASGRLLGEYQVHGAQAQDWEDIAYGPCGDASPRACLYIGDFGNNHHRRERMAVYRVPEPEIDADVEVPVVGETEAAVAYWFRFPDDGGRTPNAESLVVDPDGGIFVLTKLAERTRLLRLPEPKRQGHVAVLQELAVRDDLKVATAADLSPDGRRLVVRTRTRAWEFFRGPGESLAEAFEGDYVLVPLADERQGEAIAYTADGAALVTTSEGANPPLYVIECAAFAASGHSRTASMLAKGARAGARHGAAPHR